MSWEYETELSCGRKIYGELFCYGNSFITDIFTGEYEVVEQPMFINLHYFSDDRNDPIDWMLPRKLNPEELAEATSNFEEFYWDELHIFRLSPE